MTKRESNRKAWFVGVSMTVVGLTFGSASCTSKETLVEDDFDFDGTCTNCHAGLSAAQVHPTFKLRCVDCHGGNDQVDVPENASDDSNVYRDDALISQAHVSPKDGLARFFWANGMDDDNDGIVDEAPVINDLGGGNFEVVDFGEIAEFGLQGEGIGEFIDAEFNRDLNYVRWLNPGDLRIASVGCGGQSRPALDGEAGGGCHQRVVDSVRRSIMTNQGAVVNGAYYGNESWRPEFQNARDQNSDLLDQRAGAFGYTLDYEGIDGCVDTSAAGDPSGRGQPIFDSACLEANAAANDPASAANAQGNAGLPAFEAQQGSIVGSAPGTEPGRTMTHIGAKSGRIEWGGKPLLDPSAALNRMDPIPDATLLATGIADPVDNVLRGFRAYYPLNYPGSSNNFAFTFGESIKPGIDEHKTNNPFGRGHGSGCSSCHALYNYTGARNPQQVTELDDEGGQTVETVVDPTTKHREFDPDGQDIVPIGGRDRLVGMTVNVAERDFNENGLIDSGERDQQRFYSADHKLTSRITTDQCGLCHVFVTRINLAYQGMAEDEQRDKLARDRPIEFNTPAGTTVRVIDSWVREDLIAGGDPGDINDFVLNVPAESKQVLDAAIARNADLTELGLLPGAGGCAPNVFSEDCNNNGELDSAVLLQRFNEQGDLVAETTINEDLNNNGTLEVLSHVPRHRSLDGRQMRYVYGGSNGATRLMDIHFERGMHCIDCHFIQDSHGDGNIYSTNWDAIEVECEDCHGSTTRATLFTSGANGGNDMTKATAENRLAFFERDGDDIIQRSRVTDGLFWRIPQVPDTVDPDSEDFNARAVPAHQDQHLPTSVGPGEHNVGSVFAGDVGESQLQVAKLECYSCHTSWVHNCMGCHYNVNQGDDVKNFVDAAGNGFKVPGENETWYNNKTQPARTNFQLLSLLRSPFVLGTNAAADGGRVSPFRSSMQVHVSINDVNGDTIRDNITFTTFQDVDGNSGRTDVATSGVAMNQTMPHTVRPLETQGCESCHSVVNQQLQVQNDNILGQTYGVGTGRYPYVGDWAMVAGAGGIELFEYKQEGELAGNTVGASTRFPGLIVNPDDQVPANIEPIFNGGGVDATFDGTGIALIRNFQARPNNGQIVAPTLRDLAVTTADDGIVGRLVISDITIRGHPTAVRPSSTNTANVEVVTLPGRALDIAHLSPDVSDPFVYIAGGSAGVTTVRINTAPTGAADATVLSSTSAAGNTATAVRLAGDRLYAGTLEGTIEVFDLTDPAQPVHLNSVNVGSPVNAIDLGAFTIYAATDSGIAIFSNIDLDAPFQIGAIMGGSPVPGLFHNAGHLFVAAGNGGVRDIDVSVPASPVDLGDIVPVGEVVNAVDVTVSVLPVQTWVLASDSNGDLVGIKLDRSQSTRERCLPNAADCKNDLDWRDPTVMGRDPSIDPNNGQPILGDPSSINFFRQTAAILVGGGSFARPALWEQIGTQTGRRVRDSFMPGSGVLSQSVMQRMYTLNLCELPGSEDINGSGWGQFGSANPDFVSTGVCQPLSIEGGDGDGDGDGGRLEAGDSATTCEEQVIASEVGMCMERPDSLALR